MSNAKKSKVHPIAEHIPSLAKLCDSKGINVVKALRYFGATPTMNRKENMQKLHELTNCIESDGTINLNVLVDIVTKQP